MTPAQVFIIAGGHQRANRLPQGAHEQRERKPLTAEERYADAVSLAALPFG